MRVWNIDEIKALLTRTDQKGDVMVCKSLVQLYSRQTAAEKETQSLHMVNGIGFNMYDTKILSSMAEWYKINGWLSAKQIAIARKKLFKYSRQITDLANEFEANK